MPLFLTATSTNRLTSSISLSVVSIAKAPSACRNGAIARSRSFLSRSRVMARICFSSTVSPLACSCRTRRRALSSGLASRKNLCAAPGNTTVPVSLPSATIFPSFPIVRCRRVSFSLTTGSAETLEAAIAISGLLISSLTSSPLSRTPTSPSPVPAGKRSIRIVSRVPPVPVHPQDLYDAAGDRAPRLCTLPRYPGRCTPANRQSSD